MWSLCFYQVLCAECTVTYTIIYIWDSLIVVDYLIELNWMTHCYIVECLFEYTGDRQPVGLGHSMINWPETSPGVRDTIWRLSWRRFCSPDFWRAKIAFQRHWFEVLQSCSEQMKPRHLANLRTVAVAGQWQVTTFFVLLLDLLIPDVPWSIN